MRKRRRVIPSRWSSAEARAENRLDVSEHAPLRDELAATGEPGRYAHGCSRTRPLYEAEEAARER